jgi:P4 family phage/plasmid primase-like protien
MTAPPLHEKAAAASKQTAAHISKNQPQRIVLNGRFNQKISVFTDAKAAKTSGEMSLEDLFREVRDGAHRAPIEGIRAEQDKDQQNELKKHLKAVTFSGKVTSGGRAKAMEEGRFAHSGYLQIDLDADDLQGQPPADVRDVLAEDGNGVKAVMLVPPAATKDEHTATFLSAERYMLATYELKVDTATKDPVRMCFLSYDPEARWNSEAVPLVPITAEPSPTAAKTSKTSTSSKLGLNAIIPPPPHNGIHDWLLKAVRSCEQHGMNKEETFAKFKAYDGTLRRPFDHQELENVCREIFATPSASSTASARTRAAIQLVNENDLLDSTITLDLTQYGENDADNALRIAKCASGRFHFVTETGQWIIWNGFRWIPDKDGFMTRLHLAVMGETARQGLAMSARKEGDTLVRHAMRSRDSNKTTSALVMLRSVAGVTVSATELDADPWMLGTPNGLIDLRTGKAIEPDRKALITKSIACDLDTEATCPTWERVISMASDGDAELIQFLQSWTGYTLTGSVREECLAFLHGTGANSKGTITECIRHLMGDYAMTAPESLFVADRNSSATNDIARLAGCRMACAAELDEGASFAESRLKAITGRDAITARFLHREFFDFLPTHKFWISGNHKPTVRGNDHGIWRRLRLIPFTVTIPKEERDLDLAEKLKAEMPGILNWAIKGCLAWQRDGLVTPQRVIQATASYQAQEDIIGQFLEDNLDTADADERTLQVDVFNSYQRWTDAQGIKKPLSATLLNRKLEDRGFKKIKSNSKRYWRGISVRPW